MAAFSGLYDDVFDDGPYALSGRRPPISGQLRTLLRRRGLWRYAKQLGGDGTPATIKRRAVALGSITYRGGYDYPNRQQDTNNTVTVAHAQQGGLVSMETYAPVALTNVPAGHIGDVADINTKPLSSNNSSKSFPADLAGNGVTSPAW